MPPRPSTLQRENDRLLASAAAALERCQVGDADEAAQILEGVVTLDGRYVPREESPQQAAKRQSRGMTAEQAARFHEREGERTQDEPCTDPDGHLWVMGDKRCQVDGCTAIFRVPERGGGYA